MSTDRKARKARKTSVSVILDGLTRGPVRRLPRAKWLICVAGVAIVAAACEPAGNVELLPLPPLDRPSPEARLGLPEIGGVWRFAGWEIVEGDSMSLERTFPSFGELRIETQRLDSIAGSFLLAGSPTRIVGDVRQDGHVTLVTMSGSAPTGFLAGMHVRDTLWLELTSVLPPNEWPRDARAAFVREPVTETIAWLRGARPGDQPGVTLDSSSIAPPPDEASSVMPDQPAVGATPRSPGPGQAVQPRPGPPPSSPGVPPPASRPASGAAPSIPQPSRQPPSPAQPPATPPPSEPEPEPDTEPAPPPQTDPGDGPRLLGVPIEQ